MAYLDFIPADIIDRDATRLETRQSLYDWVQDKIKRKQPITDKMKLWVSQVDRLGLLSWPDFKTWPNN